MNDYDDIWKILQKHEHGLKALLSSWKRRKKPIKKPAIERSYYSGIHLAHCVSVRDPLKQGRVQYYSPILHTPDAPLDTLDWAWPISAMGGFDDSGLTWVPPPGSTLCLLFQNGSPDVAFYVAARPGIAPEAQQANRQFGIPIPGIRTAFL